MTAALDIVIVAVGEAGELDGFQLEIALLLDAEPEAPGVSERHEPGRLVYEIRTDTGVPFPPFVIASRAFPAIEVTFEWRDAATGVQGSARVLAGRLQSHAIVRRGVGRRPGDPSAPE